ncbi:MAG: hypothetical protein M1840_004148 [Geoglossum simile]|nr:MAG: hypothetical protein M1840_004148 [Geoglossum simile]
MAPKQQKSKALNGAASTNDSSDTLDSRDNTHSTDRETPSSSSSIASGRQADLVLAGVATRDAEVSGACRNLVAAATVWLKYSPDYCNISGVIDQLTAVQIELKEKKEVVEKQVEKIECLEKEKESEWDNFEARRDKWKEEKEILEAENEELNRQLREARSEAQGLGKTEQILKETNGIQASEIDELSKQLDVERESVRQKNRELATAESSIGKAKADRDELKATVERWEAFSSSLVKLDRRKFSYRLNALAAVCHKLAKDHFLGDLPPQFFVDGYWEQMIAPLCNGSLRLLPSNSKAARLSRVALASSIIADRLCANIFKPFYPSRSPQDEHIRKYVMINCGADATAELLCRSILTSSYTIQDAEAAAKVMVEVTGTEVFSLLEPLVSGKSEVFREDLAKFLHEASNVWWPAVRSEKIVVSSISRVAEPEKWEWSSHTDYDSIATPVSPSSPKQTLPPQADNSPIDLLTLFPRVFDPEGRARTDSPSTEAILHPGFTLRSNQKTVIDTEKEFHHREAIKAAAAAAANRGKTQHRYPGSIHIRRSSTPFSFPPGNASVPGSPTRLSYRDWESVTQGNGGNGIGLDDDSVVGAREASVIHDRWDGGEGMDG